MMKFYTWLIKLTMLIFGIFKRKPKKIKVHHSTLVSGIKPFSSPITCEIANNGKYYKLIDSFCYYKKGEMSNEKRASYFAKFGKWCKRDEIIVPSGFISDGFSNFGFHSFIPKYGRGLKCAILHDFLCEEFHRGKVSRKYADSIFLESMLETKAFNKVKCYILYFAVRIFAKIKGYK